MYLLVSYIFKLLNSLIQTPTTIPTTELRLTKNVSRASKELIFVVILLSFLNPYNTWKIPYLYLKITGISNYLGLEHMLDLRRIIYQRCLFSYHSFFKPLANNSEGKKIKESVVFQVCQSSTGHRCCSTPLHLCC